MKYQARKKEILNQLKEKGEVEVSQIATVLDVSDITIRRDLDRLSQEKLLVRTHGGAIQLERKPLIAFTEKATRNLKEKKVIAEKATLKIKEGDTIFMDCGSTTFEMCMHIKNLEIKVITNSLPIVAELQNSQVKVNFIGGEIDPKRQASHGKMAEWHINQYHADKAFIGVNAIDHKGALWAQSEKEAANSLAMIQNSKEAYVLADHSKLENRSKLKFYAKGKYELITN